MSKYVLTMQVGFEEWNVRVFLNVHCAEDRTAHVDRKRCGVIGMPMAKEKKLMKRKICYCFFFFCVYIYRV